jgi:hypothetical protein
MTAESPRAFAVGDIVKLGKTATELHDVLSRRYGAGRIQVRQRSTRQRREVAVSRLVLVRAVDAETPATAPPRVGRYGMCVECAMAAGHATFCPYRTPADTAREARP